MENIETLGRAELQLQISKLKAERSNREEALNQSFKELTFLIFAPASMKKEINNEPKDDKRALLNLSKIVINKSTDYLLDQKFGKKRSFNDFLASMFIEVLSTPFINQKLMAIFSEVRNQVFEESEEKD